MEITKIIPRSKRILPQVKTRKALKNLGWWNLYHLLQIWEDKRSNLMIELSHTNDQLRLRYLNKTKKEADQTISLLIKLMGTAEEKPPFATWRTKWYFNKGAIVCFYRNGSYETAKVVIIHDDSELTIETEDKTRWWVNPQSQRVILKWEEEYFDKNKAYYEMWLRNA